MQRAHVLSTTQASAVRTLADLATAQDGVAPLSEATLLSLGRTPEPGSAAPTHLLIEEGEALVGYGYIDAEHSAELVVAPDRRRQGHGRALLTAVQETAADARIWAHGNIVAAQSLAAATELVVIRELWQMRLDVAAHPPTPVSAPAGFTARAFEPGRDEQAWLDLNALAFAHHPEQGRMTMADLRDRMAQPWFDPAGLILVEDDETHALAASHWTKTSLVEQGEERAVSRPAPAGSTNGVEGEVYVVAVHPAYQGRGLGKAITSLGLQHLIAQGALTIDLYVEGDNAPAIATYTGQGFERSALDVMYSRR